jgi:ketosteroid isomerase-like protein
MSDKLREIAKAWNDAWNGRDAGALAAFFADGATYYEPGLPSGPVAAADGIKVAAQKTWQDWPDASFEAVSILVDSNLIAVEWRSSATHKSGTDLTLEGVDVLELDGEKIASCRVYFDIHAREQALG